jgi:hypothetical protein
MRSLMLRRFLPATLLAALLAAAACGGATATSPTTTTTTTATTVTVTDSFDGTLNQGGSNTYNFSVQPGTVTVTLASESPLATLGVGMDVGQWTASTSTCTTVLTSTAASQGTALIGTASTAIDLCIKVYDIGNITADTTVTYTVTAQHQALPTS